MQTQTQDKLSENETIKARSNFLRGTLTQSMADEFTGALAADDAQISKFHGFYQQDQRDLRPERREALLEPYYSFMLRARLPGGVCTTRQWLVIDEVGRTLGNGTLRLTARQTFQYHGILKRDLKTVIQRINQALIDSIGGCGDVNRNVLCNANPLISEIHAEVHGWARRISEHLLPKTRAYHEIWLDEEKVAGTPEAEPIYGPTYLPRKFKTAVAIPPYNDVDVYANDLGFIAITDGARLLGFNVLAGGGMGTTHGDVTTFPRLADTLGFIEPRRVLRVAEAIVTTQRDHGDRAERKHARLKYTIERMGLAAFRAEVEKRADVQFQDPRPVAFTSHGDRLGWVRGTDGRWHLTLAIENGRLVDSPSGSLLSGMRAIAWAHSGEFRITANQNLVIAGVPEDEKQCIDELARHHGLVRDRESPLRQHAMSCVALPTCPLAMAEAERYFPDLLRKIERVAAHHGLDNADIVMRMTGCPNGCARPFLAEIGLVGKAPGRYNMYVGGDGRGTRLNKMVRENVDEAAILATLDGFFARYAQERQPDERFGDFAIRTGIVRRVERPARDFHA